VAQPATNCDKLRKGEGRLQRKKKTPPVEKGTAKKQRVELKPKNFPPQEGF